MTSYTAAQAALIEKQALAHPHYTASCEDPWTYPAEEFEQRTGLSGISKTYVMPGGQDPKAVFLPLMRCEVAERMTADYCALAKEMGGVSAAHMAEFSAQLATQQAELCKEIKQLRQHGTLDELEEKAAEGYELLETEQCLNGLKALQASGPVTEEALEGLRQQAEDRLTERMNTTYAELETLNPELKQLTPHIETTQQHWAVLMGVLSKFNLPDIQRYSIDGITGLDAEKDPAWVQRLENIERQTGANVEWVPSSSTQFRMLQQLHQRDTLDAALGR